MKEITLKQLLEAGCHFGHKTTRWNPKASVFIHKAVGDTHIIDLVKTKEALEAAGEFVRKTVKEGGEVLFVGTKRQAKGIVSEEAQKAGAPYLAERWIGGFLTNWKEVKRNIEKLKAQGSKLKDKEEMVKYTKKERLLLEREVAKLDKVYGGVKNLEELPTALFIVDIKNESTALREARDKNIPIAAIVDTNADPNLIDYPIPANDDAVGSIKLIVNYIAEAYKEGKLKSKKEGSSKTQSLKDSKEAQKTFKNLKTLRLLVLGALSLF